VKPAICEQFGIEFPLFAFSHCRDVVAAVTNAGGFGVLGATAFTPEQLDQELSWIDDHVRGRSYGLDLIVPAKFEGKGEHLARGQLADRIPEGHKDFVAKLLSEHGIEPEASPRIGGTALSGDTGQELLDVAMSHPIKLIANALGVPPDYMIEAGRAHGVPVAALVGASAVVAGASLGLPPIATMIAGAGLCFGLRLLALRFSWGLPVAGSHPKIGAPRDDEGRTQERQDRR
jgi:NAD(P)H-dependent flavin oxidoreductase YrpB (nitropropane dioxygenase family)